MWCGGCTSVVRWVYQCGVVGVPVWCGGCTSMVRWVYQCGAVGVPVWCGGCTSQGKNHLKSVFLLPLLLAFPPGPSPLLVHIPPLPPPPPPPPPNCRMPLSSCHHGNKTLTGTPSQPIVFLSAPKVTWKQMKEGLIRSRQR